MINLAFHPNVGMMYVARRPDGLIKIGYSELSVVGRVDALGRRGTVTLIAAWPAAANDERVTHDQLRGHAWGLEREVYIDTPQFWSRLTEARLAVAP